MSAFSAPQLVGEQLTIVGVAVLDVITTEVTLDETWAPYCQATLTCHLPAEATIAALDPRSAPMRATFTLRDVLNPREQLPTYRDRPFNLAFRARTVDREAGTIVISLASDEALLQDWRYPFGGIARNGWTSARQGISWALSAIGATLPAGAPDVVVDAEATAVIPGTSAWDYATPLVLAGGYRLYCDEQRVWHLVDDGAIVSGTTAQLTYLGSLTGRRNTITRDTDWADACIVTYTWTDSNGTQHVAYDQAVPATYSRVRAVAFSSAKPAAGVAQRILNRAKVRGRSGGVTAVFDSSVSPSQAALLTEAAGAAPLSGVLSAVTWRLPEASMDITVRDLINVPSRSWLSVPPGRKWTDVAAGQPWTTYTP